MSQLNYHHLRYFHAVAECGNLTHASKLLNVSQSAVSVQIKRLEHSLGVALFEREHKSLKLTEEGKMVLDYARTIVQTGEELMATLGNTSGSFRKKLRVGAVATLSRNFQLQFLRPMIADNEVEVIIHSGSLGELLDKLHAHEIDLLLTNATIHTEGESLLRAHLVDRQPVSLLCHPGYKVKKHFKIPDDLRGVPLILPTQGNDIRTSFELLAERAGVPLTIAAEADDMAMLRLLAREISGMAVLPRVVVADELSSGSLKEVCHLPHIEECFYAVTVKRRHPNPLLSALALPSK
ncbi:MAG: LysR family transcriptional regulator [Verrucomicrobia bacterium]|nr:LysR family transcriptional regulator [Verrucomicrobiota bacterium]